MVSGFLDRAEKIFEQLIDEPEHRESALQQLTAIYQQTREWHKAIECATALLLGRKTYEGEHCAFLLRAGHA